MKTNEIKPIETEYNGYRFRSRLEARWAVFFDQIGMKYNYELEGYSLSDGSMYLPDFYLPDCNYYVEVKGMSDHLLDDIAKLKRFVLDKKTAVIILSNIPYDPDSKGLFWFPIQFFTALEGGCVRGHRAVFIKADGYEPVLEDCFAIGRQAFVTLSTEPYFKSESMEELEKRTFDKIQAVPGAKLDENDGVLIKEAFMEELAPVEAALNAARKARFEHGETPGFGK